MENLTRGILALLANAIPLACVICAAVVLIYGRDGWGWFLFVAAITHISYSWSPYSNEADDDEEKPERSREV